MEGEYIPLDDDYTSITSVSTSSSLNDRIEYCFGYCELYHPSLHDFEDQEPRTYLYSQFLLSYYMSPDDFMYSNSYEYVSQMMYFQFVASRIITHPTIRNYYTYQQDPNTYNIEFMRIIRLPTNETVIVKLTYLIRILQRKWRKYFQEYINCIYRRGNPLQLKYRMLEGKWRKECKMPYSPFTHLKLKQLKV